MKSDFIFLRALRHVDHTVFSVADGQKFYWDPVFGIRAPYSSGQQVKRCILESLGMNLGEQPASFTFIFDLKNESLGEGEVLSVCDPTYYDQLLGGWMYASKAIEGKVKERTLKRRSPLSISAMRPLHPLLAGVSVENITFDRSDRPELHKVVVRDANGKVMNEEDVTRFLEGTDRSLRRKWIPENTRAEGIFVYDIAIDLRTLFAVSVNQYEPELREDTIKKLKEAGWVEGVNVFGECLIMPKERREEMIPALAHALINWRITSNQSRTFSLMETLAVAVSDNANKLAGSIRAKLQKSGEKSKAEVIIDECAGADVFITLPCAGYIVTEKESVDALERAEQRLVSMMMAYDYENQLKK